MASGIPAISSVTVTPLKFDAVGGASGAKGTSPTSFADFLKSAVDQTQQLQGNAELKTQNLLTGGDVTQVEVMSAVKQAELALKLTMQIRNKLLDAYKEIQQLRM